MQRRTIRNNVLLMHSRRHQRDDDDGENKSTTTADEVDADEAIGNNSIIRLLTILRGKPLKTAAVLLLFILAIASTYHNYLSLSSSSSSSSYFCQTTTTTTAKTTRGGVPPAVMGYVPYDKIIGHLHYAKTAGTEINGYLAAHYERVCGHKGYSYDAAQFNKRVQGVKDSMMMNNNGGKTPVMITVETVGNAREPDLISAQHGNRWNRGLVPGQVMSEIGFEDCDYISLEETWKSWSRILNTMATSTTSTTSTTEESTTTTTTSSSSSSTSSYWSPALELHIPCREPLNHLMSLCHYRGLKIDCNDLMMMMNNDHDPDDASNSNSNSKLETQIQNCLVDPDRFNLGLTRIGGGGGGGPKNNNNNNNNVTLKCFNPLPVEPYLEYMDKILQRKRIQTKYVHRLSDSPRNNKEQQQQEEEECIWKPQYAPLAKRIVDILQTQHAYFRWCQGCIGSPDDLLTSTIET